MFFYPSITAANKQELLVFFTVFTVLSLTKLLTYSTSKNHNYEMVKEHENLLKVIKSSSFWKNLNSRTKCLVGKISSKSIFFAMSEWNTSLLFLQGRANIFRKRIIVLASYKPISSWNVVKDESTQQKTNIP